MKYIYFLLIHANSLESHQKQPHFNCQKLRKCRRRVLRGWLKKISYALLLFFHTFSIGKKIQHSMRLDANCISIRWFVCVWECERGSLVLMWNLFPSVDLFLFSMCLHNMCVKISKISKLLSKIFERSRKINQCLVWFCHYAHFQFYHIQVN